MLLIISLAIMILISFILYTFLSQIVFAQPYTYESTLKVEPVIEGLSSPTSMAFLDDRNLLVLEKGGDVHLVLDGVLQEVPLLQLPVNTENERGLLGIAISNGTRGINASDAVTNVFLYFTQADPLRNRVYKYQWNGQSLINPALILDLPAEPGQVHNGGKIAMGPDDYLYAVIGDLNHNGQLQNFPQGPPPDNTSVVLRVNPEDGSAASGNPFANSGNESLSRYYAYGIRNSIGMDFDPLSNNLWDTENGETTYDELNLVRPGFNSGWNKVMGPISLSGHTETELVSFPGSNYSDPLFNWREPVGLADIEFFSSSKLGSKYTNNIFVGDLRGNLYFFEVNQSRNGVKLDNASQEAGLSDLVVDSTVIKGTGLINEEELAKITFGSGFSSITDIETGPDGLLYVLSLIDGTIYKISPSLNLGETTNAVHEQRVPTTRNIDDPFVLVFSIAGVDNRTGHVINWVTANNVTRAISSNASDVDLVDTNANDGFIETSVSLPNGTIHIGDKYKACTLVPKPMYQVCNTGFNWPTNRSEFASVNIPNPNWTANSVQSQRIQKIDEGPFVVAFSVAGVGNDTGDVTSWVTANNVTNVMFYNASDTDLKDIRQDGFIETFVSLPNGTIHIGDRYKACTSVLKDDNIICNTGFNWPGGRWEHSSVTLP
jgi:aldose sugar dehydrogenase